MAHSQKIVYNSRPVSPKSPKTKKTSPIYAKVIKPKPSRKKGIKRSNRGRIGFRKTKKANNNKVSPPKKTKLQRRGAFKGNLVTVKEVPLWEKSKSKSKNSRSGNNMVF